MNIINLTPHAVEIVGPLPLPRRNYGNVATIEAERARWVRTIPASGKVARVAAKFTDAGSHDGVPLVFGSYDVKWLPPQQDGVLYIVSPLVRAACPERRDLASPAKLDLDEDGNIWGCEALEVSNATFQPQ